jgi:hypothetical protein
MLPSGTNPSLALPVVDYMTYHSASATPTLGLELLHLVVKRFLENRQWHLMFFSQKGSSLCHHISFFHLSIQRSHQGSIAQGMMLDTREMARLFSC